MENQLYTPPPPPVPSHRFKTKVPLILLIIVLLLISFFMGTVFGLNRQLELGDLPSREYDYLGKVLNKDTVPSYLSEDVDFRLFWKVWDSIKDKFIDRSQITEAQLFYGALSGTLASLNDPYSVFLDPETSKKFSEELSGKFEGIGAEIGMKNDRLTIIAPLPDSPAQKAGLKAKDEILAINEQDATGIALDYAVALIRGKKGTTVTLYIYRESENKNLEIEVKRDTIDIKSVYLEMKDDIAYIRLTHFNDDTSAEFSNVVKEVITKAPTGIILDLRNNTGGYLETAIEIAGYWVKKNDVVVRESFSNFENDQDYTSSGDAQLSNFPTIVLINGGSASASEIVAGALQDYNFAQLIGEQTFGKGSVQELEELDDGSAIKLTVARWLTPQGRSIDYTGIAPDTEVELTEENFNNDQDPQLDKALELLKK
ncbi:S41 family peptidase [Patescibacteria group bacterium]|nr:S41 family peptidase [Patescibacteria group bacterium]